MSTEALLQDSSPEEEELAVDVVYDETPDEGEEATPEVPEESPLEPPPKWDARYKEVFSRWGEMDGGREYQQAMLDLYKEQQGYATQIEQDRAEARKRAQQYEQYVQQFNGAIAPYSQFIADIGATPDQVVRQGIGILQQMRRDPADFVKQFARSANIDLAQLAQGEPWVDPATKEVQQVRQELQRIQQANMQAQQRQAWERMQQIQHQNASEINAFAEAKDASGNLLHPHLEDVQNEMAELIYGRENLRRSNPSLPPMGLDEAYQRACKLSDKVAQAQGKSGEVTRLSEKALAAKKAAEASKRTKPGKSGKAPKEQDIRDAIRENLVYAD